MSRRDSPSDSPLAVVLHRFKRENGLNNEQLGERLSIDSGTVSRLINNTFEPSVSMMNRIARFFQWAPFEYGQILMYEGYGGGKRGRRKARVRSPRSVQRDGDSATEPGKGVPGAV